MFTVSIIYEELLVHCLQLIHNICAASGVVLGYQACYFGYSIALCLNFACNCSGVHINGYLV